jgi:hypothetical protein
VTVRAPRASFVLAAAGALALTAAGAIVWSLHGDDRSPPVREDNDEGDVAHAREQLFEPAPVAEVALDPDRTEVAVDPRSAVPAADDPAERCERALARSVEMLEKGLAGPDWSRTDWDAAIGATAASLPEGAAPRLVAVFRDNTRPLEERVVAAELLRRLGHGREELADGGTIDELRRLAFTRSLDGKAGSATAAARALAWLGDDVDRARLLDRVCAGESDAHRSQCFWALAAAPADRLLPALCERLGSGLDARSTELALVMLDSVLRRVPDAGAGALARTDVEAGDAALERLLHDAGSSERVRERALLACASLADRSDDSRAAALLARCVADDAAPSERRLRAAESLLRIRSNRRDAEQRAALDHLLAVVRDVDGAKIADRRRAWMALNGVVARAAEDDAVAKSVAAQLELLTDAQRRQVADGAGVSQPRSLAK